MPVDLLVHATTHSKALKGDIQTARDISRLGAYPWGRKEGIPNFVRIRLADATELDIKVFLKPIKNTFTFTQIQDCGDRKRFDITADPNMLALCGNSKGVTLDVLLVININHTADFVSRETDNSWLTVDIVNTNFDDVISDVNDVFEEVVSPRRFHLDPVDVDRAIANGGILSQTSSQIIPGIVDRLA